MVVSRSAMPLLTTVRQPPAGGYRASWSRFDNATGETVEVGAATSPGTEIPAPGPLPDAAGAFIRIELSAVAPAPTSWAVPVKVSFRRTAGGWTLVGVERLP